MRLNNRFDRRRVLALALVVASTTAGCSDLYYDRRETISRAGGDAVEADKTGQMIDPWPAHAANTNIQTDGERMQRAIERYRTNRPTPLATSKNSVQYQPVLSPTPQASAPPAQ